MIINNIQFNAELPEILEELQAQLKLNHIPLLEKTRDSGNDIMVQCPYHGNGQEHRPSAGIRKKDGIFHCFACNETHNLQELVSYCFGHYEDQLGTFGWKWLIKNFISIAVEERKDVELDFGSRLANMDSVASGVQANRPHSGRDAKLERAFVSEEELDRYRYTHPYWEKRRITDERIIELFDLGYDKTTKCITFPVRDSRGNCLFVARRSVTTKYFNYPAGAEKPLYGLYEIYKHFDSGSPTHANAMSLDFDLDIDSNRPVGINFPQEIIVCESMLDALTAWQYGKYAVALNGLGNERQFKELRELPCRKLILATDNDEAGMKARLRIRKNVPNKIITEYMLPEGKKDLNELEQWEFEALEEVF